MAKLTTNFNNQPNIVTASECKAGDLFEIIDPNSQYNGQIIIRVDSSSLPFISLKDFNGWLSNNLSVKGRILSKGESVTLTQE